MKPSESTRFIVLEPEDNTRLAILSGQFDDNLHFIESQLGVEINNRGNQFEIIGIPKSVDKACTALELLYKETKTEKSFSQKKVQFILKSIDGDDPKDKKHSQKKLEEATLHLKEMIVVPRTKNQRHYINSILDYDINFGVGPAGTGKTFLAVACAVEALEKEVINRIVLVRPAVEAGESLGFLPGDLAQKIDPYLRPLYDALYEMLGMNNINRMLSNGIIEIAPLAYMRGRTLNDSYVILDEAQNATKEQMKMFLTRIGFGSKAVITGDITQTDLPKKHLSGLRHAITLLRDIDTIKFSFFTTEDVVRHPLVQRIIEAYEQENENV
ncbi:MAG: PhoH family protein [Gammaproteobacteria bacterium]|nr:PhoH family protein [Gammaproteobacteria bacterium]MCH9743861.1 PhoH family protein [Gammaproteobacteria bacterium]